MWAKHNIISKLLHCLVRLDPYITRDVPTSCTLEIQCRADSGTLYRFILKMQCTVPFTFQENELVVKKKFVKFQAGVCTSRVGIYTFPTSIEHKNLESKYLVAHLPIFYIFDTSQVFCILLDCPILL